jgi:hypothetical protein
MKSKIFLMVILAALIMSCGDSKDKGSMELLIKLKYGDKDLQMFTDYAYPTGQKITFSRFSFYMSQVQLKNASGTKNILDIDYLSLTNAFTGSANAAKGFSYVIPDIEEGSYSSLTFSIGVPAVDNNKTPAAFSSDNILSNQAEYWGDWKSYIFSRTEGQIDFDGDGIMEESFALHTGANVAFRTLEFPITTEIKANGTAKHTLIIDLKKQFGSAPYYDIVKSPQIHSSSQTTEVKQLIDNLVTGFTMQ